MIGDEPLISVPEAKAILRAHGKVLSVVEKKTADCLGFILAKSIKAPFDNPFFNQSAVDGFAVRIDNIKEDKPTQVFNIVSEVKAGDEPIKKLKNNTAIRLYTGSAVPDNATLVVMQEKVTVESNQLIIQTEHLKTKSNIRFKGTQIKKGTEALPQGHQLNPGSIGFLLSLGIATIKVYRKPVVSIVATGNELTQAGNALLPGMIYESNTGMLQAALHQTGFHAAHIKMVSDDSTRTKNTFKTLLEKSDILIVTGGISVGKYDLVKASLEQLGVKQLFYKISQKPGKPMYAGILNKKVVLAVPGNPAASLVCYYEYIYPLLQQLSGVQNFGLKTEMLPLAYPFTVKGDRDLFLKATIKEGKVFLSEGQESNILMSFSEANALVFLPADSGKLPAGHPVETHWLP